ADQVRAGPTVRRHICRAERIDEVAEPAGLSRAKRFSQNGPTLGGGLRRRRRRNGTFRGDWPEWLAMTHVGADLNMWAGPAESLAKLPPAVRRIINGSAGLTCLSGGVNMPGL